MGSEQSLNPHIGLSFSNQNLGFAATKNGNIWKTNNGGLNWESDGSCTAYDYGSRMCSFGNIVYFGNSNGNLYTRTLGTTMKIYEDNSTVAGTIQFDGDSKNITSGGTLHYLRGGTSNLYIDPQTSQTEKIFYKWNDGNMNYSRNDYYFDSPGCEINAYFKTKLKSTTENAISNASVTKSIKDKNSNLNLMYESMGGIFYAKSYNGGTNYIKEEIVNNNTFYSSNPPYSASGNTNPFISEVNTDQLPISPERNIIACWERRNGNNVDIQVVQRRLCVNPTFYIWERDVNNFISISSQNQNFYSHPKVFSYVNGLYSGYPQSDTIYGQMKLLTYLQPTSNGNTIKAKLFINFQYEQYSNTFDIVEGNIDDFACTVQSGQLSEFGGCKGYYIYYTYRNNSDGYILYKGKNIF